VLSPLSAASVAWLCCLPPSPKLPLCAQYSAHACAVSPPWGRYKVAPGKRFWGGPTAQKLAGVWLSGWPSCGKRWPGSFLTQRQRTTHARRTRPTQPHNQTCERDTHKKFAQRQRSCCGARKVTACTRETRRAATCHAPRGVLACVCFRVDTPPTAHTATHLLHGTRTYVSLHNTRAIV